VVTSWVEKLQNLREIIDKTVKEVADQDLVELKGWLLIFIDEDKWKKGSYGIKYIGDDITYGSMNIHEENHDPVEVFGNSLIKWFDRKIRKGSGSSET